MLWPFGSLRPMHYDVLLADPPWPFNNYSAKGETKNQTRYYATMGFDDISKLPVGNLARGDALIMMWCCWPTLDRAVGILDAWGFRYVTGWAWHKRTVHGKTAFGTGYVLRSACEPFLIGTVGAPRTSRSVRGLIEAEVREHSRKPDEQYAFLEQLMPRALHRVELFARQSRPGWDAWGNEVAKFDGVAA